MDILKIAKEKKKEKKTTFLSDKISPLSAAASIAGSGALGGGAISEALSYRDPKTGKLSPFRGKVGEGKTSKRLHRFGRKAQRYGLPLAAMGLGSDLIRRAIKKAKGEYDR